jgi:hypothetical protein
MSIDSRLKKLEEVLKPTPYSSDLEMRRRISMMTPDEKKTRLKELIVKMGMPFREYCLLEREKNPDSPFGKLTDEEITDFEKTIERVNQ